jgi:hypothetical protein
MEAAVMLIPGAVVMLIPGAEATLILEAEAMLIMGAAVTQILEALRLHHMTMGQMQSNTDTMMQSQWLPSTTTTQRTHPILTIMTVPRLIIMTPAIKNTILPTTIITRLMAQSMVIIMNITPLIILT